MSSKRQLIMIDDTYKDSYNERLINSLKSNAEKENFEFKPFEQMKPALDEIVKNNFCVILVIIRGSLYPEYFKHIKELRKKKALKLFPITFIYTSSRFRNVLEGKEEDEKQQLEQETLDSIGDEFYNPGGIGSHPYEIYYFIKKFWNLDLSPKIELSDFKFETFNDDYLIILSALINLYNKRNILLQKDDIKDLHYLLRTQHPFEKFNDFLNLKHYDYDLEAKFLINYFTSDSTFQKGMNNDFNNNYYTNYMTFTKILYRALHNKSLQSKFDVSLYLGCTINNDEFEKLQNNLKEKKKTLVYSKKFQTFSQLEEVAKKKLININDKKSLPVLFELSKLEAQEAYASNVDIGDLSYYPNNKEVLFFPFTSFIVEKIEEKEMKINSKKMKVKIIKLTYLGNYAKNIDEKKLLGILDADKIKQLLDIRFNSFIRDINERNWNESPIIEQQEFIKSLLLEANLVREISKQKNIVEIKMEKTGKFISDSFFKKYNWMFDIYFDDVLQDITTNEINQIIPDIIKIEINYPLFDCEKMFYECDNIKEINFAKFDTSFIKSLESMFSDCKSLVSVDVKNFKTQNVINMSCLFYNCHSLQKLDLSNFKLDNVVNMSAMFYMCKNLKELNFNLAEKNTKKLKDISFLFKGCYSLKNYDLSKFDMSKIEYKEGII